ncbi:MAG: hypothetical protein KF873_04895 [Gemmataceae bacterium]|nr:hypothetical protein [Gemmataceae bacterium]
MDPKPALPGVACAPRLDCAIPIRPTANEPAGIPPQMAGFERTNSDETAILAILRVLHESGEPRVLSGVERAFVLAGRTLFAELVDVCDRMLERTRAAQAAPLSPPPKPKTKRTTVKEPPAQ